MLRSVVSTGLGYLYSFQRAGALAALALCVVCAAASPRPAVPSPARVEIDYPEPGSIFPPEFPAPLFLWRDASPDVSFWRIEVSFARGGVLRATSRGERMTPGKIDERCVAPTNEPPALTAEQAAARTWRPDAALWEAIKKRSIEQPATITIAGYRDERSKQPLSSGQVAISTSKDPTGAPIFYRDVPLMPSETVKGVVKPLAPSAVPLIAWRLRNVADTESRLLMTGLHTCANCHSFSRDGKTLGMDVDGPHNDKGLYAMVPVRPHTEITKENVVEWRSSKGKLGGSLRVAFMAQISPDGNSVIATINDPGPPQTAFERQRHPADIVGNYYVANFMDYRFLQVFYATRGVLGWYSKETGRMQPLPGADDPRYVHTNAVWSPDGEQIVFARAAARDAYPPQGKLAQFANDPAETQIQYDLYRIPFNHGKGGQPEPVIGASQNGMSNSFPRISPDGRWLVFVKARNGMLMRPDSELYIVPAKGGEARRMRCNTRLMNSWHSWSPNSRWMVFASKARSPYTQMYLTHIDENGNDSPPILIENSTAANRAVNLPEFVNIPPNGLIKMDAPVTEFYRVFDEASEASRKRDFAAAVPLWRRAAEMDPGDARVYNSLGLALFETGSAQEAVAAYRKGLELAGETPEAHNGIGRAYASLGRISEAVAHFEMALAIDPLDAGAHTNLGAALAAQGRVDDAIRHYEAAIAAQPGSAEARNNLAIALARQGRLEEAIPHLEAAVKANPESFECRYNLGRMLAVSGKAEQAIPHLEKALAISVKPDASVLDVLAAMYADVGRFPDAVSAAKRGLEAAKQAGNQQLIDGIAARLRVYESGRALKD